MHGARDVASREDALVVGASVIGSGAFAAAVNQLLTRKRTTAETFRTEAEAEKAQAEAAQIITTAFESLVATMTEQLTRAEAAAGAAMSAAAQAAARASSAERATAECHQREERLGHRVTLLEARIADMDAGQG